MHNPMNRNPEENRPLDPFAAAEAPEMASETTYPVEADGEIHELTLDELIEAAAQGLSKHNAYVRRNRRAAVGTAQTDGEPAGIDPVTLALLGR